MFLVLCDFFCSTKLSKFGSAESNFNVFAATETTFALKFRGE